MEMSKKKTKVALSVKLDCQGEKKISVKDDKPDDQVKKRRISKRLASQQKSLGKFNYFYLQTTNLSMK